jgi:KRAB domain-containing zinc finger protein
MPFFCSKCPKTYNSRGALKSHLAFKHSSQNKQNAIKDGYKYPCPHCDRKFRAPCNLEIHLPKHSNERKFICTDCSKSFKFKPELTAHKKLHADECKYECKLCGLRFTSNWKLTHHMISHSNVRSFSCTLCKSAFKQKATLDGHMKRVHDPSASDVKSWICSHQGCGKFIMIGFWNFW